MRAALYSRYSTGNQSPLSIEDQLRLCRQLATKLGAKVVREFTDAEISGFVSNARPGVNALLDFARHGGCDVVIAEHSDRLARDGQMSWAIFNLFRGLGVRYVTVQEGEVTIIHQGVSTLVSELKGEEARHRTRRGLQGVVESGRSGGGLTFGYRKLRRYDSAGEPIRGLLEIDPGEAEVVRRIFREYAAGASPVRIAHALNAEQVAGPRGGQWNASTIAGSATRGVGIIHNELYIGVRIWGRRTFVKDRATGTRRGRMASEAPVRREAPELRIVDQELWEQVRTRHSAVSTGPMGQGLVGRTRPKRLLQGLLVCGLCGRPMWRSGPNDAFRCSTRVEKGVCANTAAPSYPGIEARVIASIRANLLEPAAVELAIREIHTARAEAARGRSVRKAKLSAELAEVRRRMGRLIDQLEEGTPWQAIADRHGELEARRAAIEAELQEADQAAADDVIQAHPSTAARYRQLLEDLSSALDVPETEERAARDAIRALIQEVRFTPREPAGAYELEIVGDLAPILHLNNKKAPSEEGAFCRTEDQSQRGLGAGTGFEPVTFRL